jgi:hypothetical protein
MDAATIEAEIERRNAQRDAAFEERVRQAAELRSARNGDLIKDVEAFEAASGIKIRDGWLHSPDEVGRAVKAILKTNVLAGYHGLQAQAQLLRSAADKIDAGLAEMGIEPRQDAPAETAKRRRRSAA